MSPHARRDSGGWLEFSPVRQGAGSAGRGAAPARRSSRLNGAVTRRYCRRAACSTIGSLRSMRQRVIGATGQRSVGRGIDRPRLRVSVPIRQPPSHFAERASLRPARRSCTRDSRAGATVLRESIARVYASLFAGRTFRDCVARPRDPPTIARSNAGRRPQSRLTLAESCAGARRPRCASWQGVECQIAPRCRGEAGEPPTRTAGQRAGVTSRSAPGSARSASSAPARRRARRAP